MINRIILFPLLLFAGTAIAEPQDWMKQENPNELALWVSVSSDCPFTREEILNGTEGEFLRARIKPVLSGAGFNLTVAIHCMKVETQGGSHIGFATFSDVRFGRGLFLYDVPWYGGLYTIGPDGASKVKNVVEEIVSNALTDYLKANFQD